MFENFDEDIGYDEVRDYRGDEDEVDEFEDEDESSFFEVDDEPFWDEDTEDTPFLDTSFHDHEMDIY